MAAKLPEQSLEDLRATFIQMDGNGDGRIQHEEFKKAIKITGINMTEQEIKDMATYIQMDPPKPPEMSLAMMKETRKSMSKKPTTRPSRCTAATGKTSSSSSSVT